MEKKINRCILIFSAYMPPHVGGIERYISNLVVQFVKLGYKPIVVTSNYDNTNDYEAIDGVDIIRLPIYNVFKNRYPIVKLNKKTRELMNKLDDYNIERVIVNTRFHLTSHVGIRYANKKKIPVYLIEHGSNYVTLDNKFIDFFANRYEDFLTYLIKNRVTGFYGVSDACGKWLLNFSIKYSGTWSNSIDFGSKSLSKVKHTGINFLYAGRIIKQKGVNNILSSFNILLSKYDNINLYIAGSGPEEDRYKEQFSNERIHFLGRLSYDELLKYYAKCDVFLYPPLWPEGLPTSILEAAMMKCTIIATNQGGIAEIINNDNGIIVDGSVSSLEDAMERVILDKKLRDKLANNVYEYAKDNFSWEVTAKKILVDMNLEKK